MNTENRWNELFSARLSRREAIRAATLGVLGFPLVRAEMLVQGAAASTVVAPAADYALQLTQLVPALIATDVSARKGNKKAWPVLEGVSIAQVEVPVGGWRAPHLHTNTPELAVVLQGTARVGLQTPQQQTG